MPGLLPFLNSTNMRTSAFINHFFLLPMNLVLVLVLVLVLDFLFPRRRFRGSMRETFRRNLCPVLDSPQECSDRSIPLLGTKGPGKPDPALSISAFPSRY